MSVERSTVASSGIGGMLVSSRSLAEYRAMFDLSDADLGRRVLDCPAGASSFTAEVNATGGDVTACDPIYADQGPVTLARRSRDETNRGNAYVRAHPEQYRWSFFADPDEHQRSRHAAGSRFAADMERHPNRYVAGSLPALPFIAGNFDLVLSSHLLFSYADRLDFAFHRAAILELVRVAREEVRIFPLVAMGAVAYPNLDQLRAQLSGHGVRSRIVDVNYELQAGGYQMMTCHRVTY